MEKSDIRKYKARILNAWTSFIRSSTLVCTINPTRRRYLYITDISISVSTNAYITFISFNLNNLEKISIYDFYAFRHPCSFMQRKTLFFLYELEYSFLTAVITHIKHTSQLYIFQDI